MIFIFAMIDVIFYYLFSLQFLFRSRGSEYLAGAVRYGVQHVSGMVVATVAPKPAFQRSIKHPLVAVLCAALGQ